MLRKYYGNLPPTDPRILRMTEEQVELELALIKRDLDEKRRASGEQVYEDEEYDQYDEESEQVDSMITYQDAPVPHESVYDESEWEDVEDE